MAADSNSVLSAQSVELLLEKIKSPDFNLTLTFEKILAEAFCKHLNDITCVVEYPSDYVASFCTYLECVLAIADVDKKFINLHFSKLDHTFYEKLATLMRREKVQRQSQLVLHLTILKFVKLIIHNDPPKIATFTSIGLHKVLLTKPAVLDSDFLMSRIEILEILMDGDGGCFRDISSVHTLDSLFSILEHFADTGSESNGKDVVLKLLEIISRITSECAFHNINHLRKFDDVFLSVAQRFPEIDNVIKAVFNQVTEAKENSAVSSRHAKSGSSNTSRQRPKVLQHQMSILDIKPTLNSKVENRSSKVNTYILNRFMIINNLDPEMNACSVDKSIDQISLDVTAELICGMLNSNKGGTIHFGIHTSGRIDGVRVNYDQRDGFRCGVDNLFLTKLSPLLPSSLVNIDFIPVRVNLVKKIDHNHKLYVIRIVVPAQMNTVYYLKDRNLCFFRRPEGDNVELSLKDVRQLAVILSEQRLLLSK